MCLIITIWLYLVFGPTLLKTTEGSASLSSLVDTVHQTRVVELLTKYSDTIFGPPDSFLASDKSRDHKMRKHGSRYRGNSESDHQDIRKGKIYFIFSYK